MAIRRLRATFALGVLVVVAAMGGETLTAPPARAEAFGEIARVGSFGEGPGEFDFPHDLAVDTEDNSAFVLDAPEAKYFGIGRSIFRVQKFSSALAWNASATIATPEVSGHRQWVVSIAVDPVLKRLYVLTGIETERSEKWAEHVASQIDVYSTEPSGGNLPVDSEIPGGVFYSFPAVPTSGEVPAGTVGEPHGLAVDPVTHTLIVLGDGGEEKTLLEQIKPTGLSESEGKLGETYLDTNDETSGGAGATGVAVAGQSETLYLSVAKLPNQLGADGKPAGVVELSPTPGLATPTITLFADGGDPVLTGGSEYNRATTHGAQLAISPEGSTLYAAEMSKAEVNFPGEPPAAGSYEIRGMSTEGQSRGEQTVVFGGGSSKCLIATESQAIAAGSGGTVYVLDEGNLSEGGPTPYGFDLVKFGPGGSGCPSPSAEFKINGDENSPSVTVNKGESVRFEAQSATLNGEEPVELDWDFEGSGAYATKVTGAPAELTTTNEYYKPGAYTVGLKISLLNNGTYGNPPPVTRRIEVVASPPIATFEVSSLNPKPGEMVKLNGGESLDPDGSCSPGHGCGPTPKMKSYEWRFGDGKTEITSGPEYERPFANSGTEARSESVSLVVTNEEGVQSSPSSQTLTIQGTPEATKEPTKEPVKEPTKEPIKEPVKEVVKEPIKEVTPIGKTTPVVTPQVKKPLTNAQKLANALKECKKDKSKKARASCEKQAKSRYAPAKAKKKKTGKKGK